MAERVQVREIDDDEGQWLLRIVRCGTGPVATWRRAQVILLPARGMPPGKIAGVTLTSADRVRDVIRNFSDDGFASPYPEYPGGRPRTFTLPERWEIKKTAKSGPSGHGLPFSAWSLSGLAGFLVAGGPTTSPARACGSRSATRASPFQAVKTWRASADPGYEAKKARAEHLHAIADGEIAPGPGSRGCLVHGRVRAPEPAAPPRATSPGTGCTATSGHARSASSSWDSAAACAPCTPATSGSRSSATTSRRT